MKKNTSVRAWEYAREMAAERGGSPRDYFSEAMKRAINETYIYARLEEKADRVIKNFRDLFNSMVDDEYNPIHHRWAAGSKFRITDKGRRLKETSAGWVDEVLDGAIETVGNLSVATNIQLNGEHFQQIIEDLIFAVYDGKYAVWGSGGKSAYVSVLISDIEKKLEQPRTLEEVAAALEEDIIA